MLLYSFLNVQLHHKEDQPFEAIQIAALYLMETARVFCGYPMVNACLVFNLDNFTLANMVSCQSKRKGRDDYIDMGYFV